MAWPSYSKQPKAAGPRRNFYLQDSAYHAGYRVKYPTLSHPTVIRVIPVPDPERPGCALPCRSGEGLDKFTDWCTRVHCWTGGTARENSISFICSVPTEDGFDTSPATIRPPDEFVQNITRAAEQQKRYSDWLRLLIAHDKRGALLRGSSTVYFMHAVVAEHNGSDYRDEPQMKQVVALRKTGGESLEALCNTVNNAWKGSRDDMHRYQVGDWLGTTPENGFIPGNLLVISSTMSAARSTRQEGGGMNLQYDSTASKSDNRGTTISKYFCALGDPQSIPSTWPAELYLPWDKTLQLYTPEEQVQLLSRVFPREMLQVGFAGCDYLPSSLATAKVIDIPPPAGAGVSPEGIGGTTPPPTSASVAAGKSAFSFGTRGIPRASDQLPVPSFDGAPPVSPDGAQPSGDPLDAARERQDQLARMQKMRASIDSDAS